MQACYGIEPEILDGLTQDITHFLSLLCRPSAWPLNLPSACSWPRTLQQASKVAQQSPGLRRLVLASTACKTVDLGEEETSRPDHREDRAPERLHPSEVIGGARHRLDDGRGSADPRHLNKQPWQSTCENGWTSQRQGFGKASRSKYQEVPHGWSGDLCAYETAMWLPPVDGHPCQSNTIKPPLGPLQLERRSVTREST